MTAENKVAHAGAVHHVDASMRPRPMTAENRQRAAPLPAALRRASMRPRPMTAENADQHR